MTLTGSLSLISFSLSAFLAGLLWFDRERRAETRLLAALLAIHSVAFLLRYGFTSRSALVVYLPFLVFPLLTLHGPLVELFVRRSLFDEGLTRLRRLPLLFGPAVSLVAYGVLFATIGEFRDREAILSQATPVALFSRLMILLYGVYSALFLLRAWGALRLYRERFQESFSNLDGLRLEFLRAFLGFTGAFYLAYTTLALVSFLFAWHFPVTPLESLLLLGLTYLVLYYLVRRPQIFTLTSEAPEPQSPREPPRPAMEPVRASEPKASPVAQASASSTTGDRPKYSRQSLDAATRRSHLKRIQAFMEAERPYLDGELALADLAQAVEIPKHHVSMAINIELEQNFFQFVNAYRVHEARRLLADPALAEENLLNIAYRAGFQSKAAFNKVFKKSTDQTPGQYRAAAAARN